MNEYPIVTKKIKKDIHVDDYINGIRIYHRLKMIIQIVEQTYAKQLFSSSSGHTKILGLGWNKITNKINIEIPQFSERQITKRNMTS